MKGNVFIIVQDGPKTVVIASDPKRIERMEGSSGVRYKVVIDNTECQLLMIGFTDMAALRASSETAVRTAKQYLLDASDTMPSICESVASMTVSSLEHE